MSGTHNTKSIYDTTDMAVDGGAKVPAIEHRASTLPTKQSDYK